MGPHAPQERYKHNRNYSIARYKVRLISSIKIEGARKYSDHLKIFEIIW